MARPPRFVLVNRHYQSVWVSRPIVLLASELIVSRVSTDPIPYICVVVDKINCAILHINAYREAVWQVIPFVVVFEFVQSK